MRQVVTNAAALADTLRRHGIRLYAGGTDTHMVVADLRATDWTVPVLNAAMLAHGIIGSTTGLPARPGNLGLRLGSTAMTIRGARPDQMVAIGESLAGVLLAGPTAAQDAVAATRMGRLARELPIPFQAL